MAAPVMSSGLDAVDVPKLRGAFYTPAAVARHLTRWAVRSRDDAILEPSCGEAAFLLAAVNRLAELGGPGPDGVLDGVEVFEPAAVAALRLLGRAGVQARVQVEDFFDVAPTAGYDAVLGNPPYVRYQDFGGESRAKSRAAALRAGVQLTGLASSWAAFVVHASLFLRRGGRLALVLPAELVSVNYAAPIRAYLLDRFAETELIFFTERVFPGVQEEVVLLLADGFDKGPSEQLSVREVGSVADLHTGGRSHQWRPSRFDEKWSPALLSGRAADAYSDLRAAPAFTDLESWGDTTLGMVTGNNRYFALSADQVAELGLARRELLPLSPPGSRHLRGLDLTAARLRELEEHGAAVWLFRPGDRPSAAARSYIARGVADGVDQAYKCRVRSPWWQVPLVAPADLLLTYMNADTPRLTTNAVGAHNLNSVHGVYLRGPTAAVGRRLLPLGSLNSLTLLGAELVGRSYGGGLLKLEPREADRLPVPSAGLLGAVTEPLVRVRRPVARLLESGDLAGAVDLVDRVLLLDHLRVDADTVASLQGAWSGLAARRSARGRESRPT